MTEFVQTLQVIGWMMTIIFQGVVIFRLLPARSPRRRSNKNGDGESTVGKLVD